MDYSAGLFQLNQWNSAFHQLETLGGAVGFSCHWRFSREGTQDSRAEYNSSSGR